MTEDRLYRMLSRVADIRRGEARKALLLFLYFFLVTFPVYIIKPVKVSLFFVSFSDRFLPLPYLLTALLIGFVVSLNARFMRSLPRRRYISLTLVFFMAGFIVFWLLWKVLRVEWNGLSIVYWLWSDVFISTAVIQFWISVNDALHPHQAKRLVGFFVSGGLLGGLGGALLAWRLASVIGTENLLLFCPAVLVLTLIVVRRVYRDREGEGEWTPDARPGLSGYWEGFRAVRGHRYLRLLAGLLSAGAVAGTLIELQFNTILGWHFRSADPRTAFLGSFFAVLLAVSWFVQMFGTSRILKRFGIRGGLLAAPLLLLIGSASIFLFSTPGLIVWAVIVKGMDKSLENTLNQSARELLYIPVPADVKDKAKVFIDMFLNKFSTALGAVLFFGFYTALRLDIEVISVVTVAFLALAIVLAAVIFGEYIRAVKRDLARKWEDGEKIVAAHVDMDSARLVVDTLQSRERSSELYVMNLYDLIRKDRMTPELKEILAGMSGEARARSMDSLLDVGGETFFPGMEDALADKELGTEINEVFELESYRKVMGDHLEKLTGGGSESEVERMEAAKVLGMMKPDSGVVTQLSRLLGDRSSEVLNYALASAARLRRKEHIPLVIRQLGNPQTSRVARDALVVYGEAILGTLRRRLEDSREPLQVRKAIPEVLAILGTQRSADVLTAALQEGQEATETEVIEALYRIRAENPGVLFKEKKILPSVMRLVRRNLRRLAGEGPEAVEGFPAMELKRIFDLLSLIYPSEDIVKAYQNICQGTRKAIDYSLELLDNVVCKDLMEYLAPLIEDLPPEERSRRCRKLLRSLGRKELRGRP
jgi:ATP:ADP antiporter, AAA family